MTIIGKYSTINGVKTYYEENDAAPGLPLVCVHTAGRETRQYHGMMDILNGRRKIIALDMPAHGKSWPLPGNKAITERAAYADFIWAFTQTMGIEAPVVMGCSLGGNIVYELAQRYPMRAIISLQGADYTPSISDVARALMDHPHVSLQHSHMDFSDSLIGKTPVPGAREFILWGVSTEISITKKADLTMYAGFDVRATQDRITCPVLVVRGEDDWIVDEEAVDGTVSRLTRAERVVVRKLPEIGHFPVVEQPQTMCDVVEEFLATL